MSVPKDSGPSSSTSTGHPGAREAELLAEIEFLRRQLAANSGAHRSALADSREEAAYLEHQVQERTRDRNSLWELSSDIMLRCGPDGTITAVNPAWSEVLGWQDGELVGSSLFALIHSEDLNETSGHVADLAARAGHARFDNRYRHRDGRYRWISWSASSGEGMINAVGRDFTTERENAEALKAAEEALRQSQKMEAVGQLTGGVAHDFNNFLTVIRSSVDLLKRPDLAEERRRRYIDAISDTTTRAARLTGQLLAFARRQALMPEVFDVAESVRAITGMMMTLTGSRITIETQIPAEPCFVNADANQFDTSVVNMAVNARDAMGGEGTLTVAVATASAVPAYRGHPRIDGEFVKVAISDTGTGITAEHLDKIFEPFFTTKGVGHGTGLGLSQVFGFSKQSGGEVVVETALGQGTTFTLYLPRVAGRPAVANPEQPEVQHVNGGNGTRVLVVEDNHEVGTFAAQSLEELGYRSVLVRNADAALAELAKDASAFDVVFSDVVMPGTNGIDLAHEIRRRYVQLPVILTSGYSNVLAQSGSHGFELLHKPYSIEQLAHVLTRAAHWRRLRRVLDAEGAL